MKRFQFIPLLALAVAACGPADEVAVDSTAEAPTTGTPADEPGFNFTGDFEGPLGLQLWSVREAMQQDVPGTLRRVHEMGFREVELAGTYGMTPEQFRQELDRAGLRATSMHVGYDRLRDSLDAVLDEAEALGVDYVGLAWIPHEGTFNAETARRVAEDFNRWGRAAQERGVQFFYHNHGYEFQPGPDGALPMDILMQETDPEAVKYEMDVLWTARPGQDPAAWLRKYPDRWELMHIKDLREGASTSDHSGSAPPEDEVPVGQGQIDWPAVLRAAEEIGLDRYYVEDETTDPLGNIPQSVDYLESVQY